MGCWPPRAHHDAAARLTDGMELAGLEPATSWVHPDRFVQPCSVMSTKCLHMLESVRPRGDARRHEETNSCTLGTGGGEGIVLPGRAIQATVTVHRSAGLLTPGPAIAVLGAYATIAMAAALIRVAHTDA
jgi:hypothetical protein